MKYDKTQIAFLVVYISISIATVYHSAFGFGTLEGLDNNSTVSDNLRFWLLGGLSAASIDIGMGAVVYAMLSGKRSKFLSISLIVLALFSAYTQIIYASVFAKDIFTVVKNEDLRPIMQTALDYRILLLPIALPFLAVFFGFSAKKQHDTHEELLDVSSFKKEYPDIMAHDNDHDFDSGKEANYTSSPIDPIWDTIKPKPRLDDLHGDTKNDINFGDTFHTSKYEMKDDVVTKKLEEIVEDRMKHGEPYLAFIPKDTNIGVEIDLNDATTITTELKKSVTHMISNVGGKSLCGNTISLNKTSDADEVSCKNCLRIMA